jgi:hypothetical protein
MTARAAAGRRAAVSAGQFAAERFQVETARHHMYVARDDGLYRHLQFRDSRLCNDAEWRVNTGFYWFDLITWPGVLTITGDMDTFVFSRVTDMFEFFRACGHRGGINPGYWSEKLRAPDPRAAKAYDQDRVREYVIADLAAAVQFGGVPRGTGRAIREQIFDHEDITWEEGAHMLLRDFKHEGFQFHDTWEWDLRGYSQQFLWCCHAIQWGIRQYDTAHAEETQVPA